MRPNQIGIYVFDLVEVLDFAGPFEVFTTASRMAERLQRPDRFDVRLIGRTTASVRARAGLKVVPDHGMTDHPPLDLLVIPGGVVTDELAKPDVARWIAQVARHTPVVASVCTGAFLLAQAGLLDGKRATTHWEDLQDLQAMFPQVSVQEAVRWVDEGSVVTSAGIAAGIDMSLHLVARLADIALARKTARQMDVDWVQA